MCLNDLERAYWMGTEIGQLEDYGFQEVTLGVDGSCKDEKMGSGCLKFREEGEGQLCASWQRRGRHELKQARVGRGGCSVAVGSSSRLRRRADWVHSGIKNSVCNSSRRKNCGKRRRRRK